MNINDTAQATQSHHHSIWNLVDPAALVAGLSSPVWWEFAGQALGTAGQSLIVLFAVVGGGIRCALLIREWRRGR